MLIVWDTHSGTPVRSYFGTQLGAGCAALDLAADAMHVVTVSDSTPQRLCVWDWTAADRDAPLVTLTLPSAAPIVRLLDLLDWWTFVIVQEQAMSHHGVTVSLCH
jgi:hypothetical protein